MRSEPYSTSKPGFFTYAQLIVSGLGFLGGVASVIFLAILAVISLFVGDSDPAGKTAIFSILWVCGLTTILLLPSVFFSFSRLRLLKVHLPEIDGFRAASFLMFTWPIVLLLGHLAAGQEQLAWLLLPPLQLMAIGLPILWILNLVHMRLQNSSSQRTWGIVSGSLLVTTPLVVIIEMIVFGILAFFFVMYLIDRPDLLSDLESMARRFMASQSNPEMILPIIRPYFEKPIIVFGLLALLSGVIPLLEELFKPLALWTLAGRDITPVQGFTGGALCGGMFALLESLMSLTQPGEGWLALAIGRAGTGVLHITTSALIGWALASAWQNGAYLRLGLTYLFSASIHGLWNAMSVFTGINTLMGNDTGSLTASRILAQAAPAVLVILVILMLAILWGVNRKLQNEIPPSQPPVSTGPANLVNGDF